MQGIFDKLSPESKKFLGIDEGIEVYDGEPSIVVSLHPKLKEDLDEYSIEIFRGLMPVYTSCELTSREKRIINGNWMEVRGKFLKMISYHLGLDAVKVAKRPEAMRLAPIEMQESLAGLASELGKGLHLFDQTIIPYYVRFALSDEDKKNILGDMENVVVSFKSLLLSCAGREMDDADSEEA